MKIRRSAAAAALAATGTQGQAAYGSSSPVMSSSTSPSVITPTPIVMTSSSAPYITAITPPLQPSSVSYTTVTYSDCPSSSMSSLITVTQGLTITYCPECDMMSASSSGYTTVYTTTYESLCPTGIVPETYTVTESCTEATPTWTPGPSHIPNGFTVTTKECTVCDKTPTTVTITEPCGCEATNGVPVTNTATTTGGGSGSDTNTPVSTTWSSSPGSGSPSGPASPSCNDSECGGSENQSGGSPTPGSASPPYPTTATQTCPGPQCRAAASSYPSGVTYGNTSGITPSTGEGVLGFSSTGPFTSVFLAVVVAALAFML